MAEIDRSRASSGTAYGAPGEATPDLGYQTALRRILITRFYDGLPGEGKVNKARELIDYLKRYDRMADLVRIGKLVRPDIPWEHPLGVMREPSSSFHSPGGNPRFQPRAAPSARTSGFARATLSDWRARVVAKMSKTVSELDTYIEQYGRAISAHRLSTILRERIRKLRLLQVTDPGWELYWEAVETIYDELVNLAFGMTTWREARQQKREFSDITTEIKTQFVAKEQSILALVERHTKAHTRVQALSTQLRQSVTVKDDQVLRELEEQVREMHSSADIMGRQLYPIINQLIKKELNTLLTELGQPQEVS